jgi:type I restriction enzyme S subunit
MKLPTVREQIETRLTGTSPTMKNISKPALLELLFPVPDPATQAALMDLMAQKAKASKASALEASELRRAAWAAFEVALFQPAP